MSIGTDKVSAVSITEDECRRSTRVGLELIGVTGDSVSLSKNDVNEDIDAGRLSKLSQDFNVTACNAKSYKVYVQAESSLLKNQQMPDALYGVGEKVTESAFPENTWGYNISPTGTTEELTYSTVPELSASIPEAYTENGSTSNTGKALTITFAANFGKNKTAGHYTSDILLSAVIEPKTAQELWNSITYMQDMTPEACTGGDELGRQLIDRRDGKSYWVAKLKDGNCWMVQNLDLDLEGVTLTPDDSNVSANWVSDTGPSTASGYDDGNFYLAQYYNPGYAYYTNNTSTTTTTKNDLDDTSGEQWAKDTTGNENTHYMQGNLYSWTAATAGSGDSSVTSGNAPDSICPKGWQLPTSNNTDATQKSFGGLTSGISAGSTLVVSPYYFVYGGFVGSGSLYNAGSHGYYWSSTASDSNHAYYLYFDSNDVDPSGNSNRYSGLSVRCVIR